MESDRRPFHPVKEERERGEIGMEEEKEVTEGGREGRRKGRREEGN